MSPIDKDELFQHISGFFQSKGVELKDGPYKNGIQKGCGIMADVANSSREALEKARDQFDKTMEQVRQTIHEKTAPKNAAPSPAPSPTPPPPPKPAASSASGSAKPSAKPRAPKKPVKPVKKAAAPKSAAHKKGK